MDTAPLRDLLAARLGFDADSAGPSFLGAVARRSLEESGYADLPAFIRAAAAGGDAWHTLLEHVVVCETWFFRDHAPFTHIVDAVRRAWKGPGSAPVRILSCPCSTGEEPYSVAIALSDAGLPPDAFTIDAADVSPRALSGARAGIFGPRSFRGADPVDRERYFDHESGSRQWRIKPAFQAMVAFRVANLASPEELQDVRPYHVVLCRNLLIYLHAEARSRVIASLRQLMADEGLLIVGHAEPAIVRGHGLLSAGDPGAFACVRSAVPETSAARISARKPVGAPGAAAPPSRVARPAPASTAAAPPPLVDATLERIRQLGDQGRTEEAILACRDYVRRVPDSADAYFLLGVLSGALGRRQAATTALRRALYLEPDHAAALLHLALASDASGDAASAARLRARAERSRAAGKGGR